MIKTLEAWCKARGYQGGTIFQCLEDLSVNRSSININLDTYRYGYREGNRAEHGTNLASYSVPVNSWDNDAECTLAYILGVEDGIADYLGRIGTHQTDPRDNLYYS